MSIPDEPLLDSKDDEIFFKGDVSQEDFPKKIHRLIDGQPFAVLCTQGQEQPYGSLVAYAMTDDLSFATFATPRATRKFRLLSECEHVALLIDNRSEFPGELMRIEALTVTGRAKLIEDDADFEHWSALLIDRHPYLKRFVQSSSSGIFRIEILRYLHVSRFQEVRQWTPGRDG